LRFVNAHPSYVVANIIGLHWIDGCVFLCNTSIFAEFIGRKPNSLNYNFRTHDFIRSSSSNTVCRQIKQHLCDPRNWKTRQHPNIHIAADYTEEDAGLVKFCPPSGKTPRTVADTTTTAAERTKTTSGNDSTQADQVSEIRQTNQIKDSSFASYFDDIFQLGDEINSVWPY
jgi:hypothetical protein